MDLLSYFAPLRVRRSAIGLSEQGGPKLRPAK